MGKGAMNKKITYNEYFKPITSYIDKEISTISLLADNSNIGQKDFFKQACKDSDLLKLWVSQEAVVTNPFSQTLLQVISNIRNVHVRSILLPVVVGEHSKLINGTAIYSHPWLLWKLCKSMAIGEDLIVTPPVDKFIDILNTDNENIMFSLGILGVGNERILITEYKAIRKCFESISPSSDYKQFLESNIAEDVTHTQLIEIAATVLVNQGFSLNEYREGAILGVNARLSYYDELLSYYYEKKLYR